jgi:hypothetical protein
MATTASISISSDITDNIPFSISADMTMYQAGTTLDLEETTGLAQRTYSGNTNQVDLITIANENLAINGANKVYIRNTGTDKTKHFTITLGQAGAGSPTDTEEIGRLYGGDWMLFPYDAYPLDADDTDGTSTHANNWDVCVTPSSAEKMTIEYAVFHQ